MLFVIRGIIELKDPFAVFQNFAHQRNVDAEILRTAGDYVKRDIQIEKIMDLDIFSAGISNFSQ